jgi:hypothetical protein
MLTFITGVSVMQESFSFDEVSPNNQATNSESSGTFKQLTNTELVKYFEKYFGETSPIPDSKSFLKKRQGGYNFYLKMLYAGSYDDKGLGGELNTETLKKLQWKIKTDKQIYKSGESIVVQLSLKNISQEDIQLNYSSLRPGFILNSIHLVRINESKTDDIYLTQEGIRLYNAIGFNGTPRAYKTFHLKPNEESPTNQNIKFLNQYYDLSKSGEYELTFYTRNFLADDEHQIGEYPKPCTIRFTIVDKIENNKQNKQP